MNDKEFLKEIDKLYGVLEKLFTEDIRRTEKYHRICNHPFDCEDENEKQLIKIRNDLDAHFSYRNFNLLLQIKEHDRRLHLQAGHRMVRQITVLVGAIDWNDGK